MSWRKGGWKERRKNSDRKRLEDLFGARIGVGYDAQHGATRRPMGGLKRGSDCGKEGIDVWIQLVAGLGLKVREQLMAKVLAEGL